MEKNEIISPYFENGVFAGVRVTLGDEDFVIAPKDFRNGKEMDWQEAMDTLKANGLDTWNYRQICLTKAYHEDVDRTLKDNGGLSMDNWYWTCAENLAEGTAYCSGYDGVLYDYDKFRSFSVRPIKNLKNS